jgi:hypothetical protein
MSIVAVADLLGVSGRRHELISALAGRGARSRRPSQMTVYAAILSLPTDDAVVFDERQTWRGSPWPS